MRFSGQTDRDPRPDGAATAKILVVDDHPANVVAITAVLEPLGQTLVVARSGEEALGHLLEEQFAVVLMDVQLPGIDGLEVASMMRHSQRARGVPIIFLTGVDADPSQILRGYAEGGVDYLVKPFDGRILRSKVAVFVELYQMREQMRALGRAKSLGAIAEAERERFHALFMQAPVAIALVVGPEHTFELANPLYCAMVNRTSLVGKKYLEAFPEQAMTALPGILDRVYRTGEPFVTSELPVPLDRHGDGRLEDCYFKFNLEPLRDATGEVYGQMAVAVDITTQVTGRREVEALRAAAEVSERHFRTLIDSIPALAWSARADGWIDYYNERWYRYTGTTPAQMEGWGWQSVHDPAELPRVTERWRHSIATGEPFEMRFPLRRADGEFRWHLTRVVPARDAGGRILRWFGTNTDVDDDQRTERRLAAALEQESQARAEAATALARERAAREKAEHAVRTNELFVGILGHDLRNPMSAVAMSASLLLRTVTSPKDIKTTRRIVSSAERMARMIDQLLDVTRIRVGDGLALTRERTDLEVLCRSVVDELETAHPESTLTLEVDGDDALGDWDSDRLLQALSNLVGNAIVHGVEGRPITVRLECHRETVSVLVRNDGAVPEALLPLLFDPFRGSRKDKKGLGLGLYITQQIVLAHGGTIRVDSSEAAGTTFVVDLPRAPPPA